MVAISLSASSARAGAIRAVTHATNASPATAARFAIHIGGDYTADGDVGPQATSELRALHARSASGSGRYGGGLPRPAALGGGRAQPRDQADPPAPGRGPGVHRDVPAGGAAGHAAVAPEHRAHLRLRS